MRFMGKPFPNTGNRYCNRVYPKEKTVSETREVQDHQRTMIEKPVGDDGSIRGLREKASKIFASMQDEIEKQKQLMIRPTAIEENAGTIEADRKEPAQSELVVIDGDDDDELPRPWKNRRENCPKWAGGLKYVHCFNLCWTLEYGMREYLEFRSGTPVMAVSKSIVCAVDEIKKVACDLFEKDGRFCFPDMSAGWVSGVQTNISRFEFYVSVSYCYFALFLSPELECKEIVRTGSGYFDTLERVHNDFFSWWETANRATKVVNEASRVQPRFSTKISKLTKLQNTITADALGVALRNLYEMNVIARSLYVDSLEFSNTIPVMGRRFVLRMLKDTRTIMGHKTSAFDVELVKWLSNDSRRVCVLCKLVVYNEGGKLVVHPDSNHTPPVLEDGFLFVMRLQTISTQGLGDDGLASAHMLAQLQTRFSPTGDTKNIPKFGTKIVRHGNHPLPFPRLFKYATINNRYIVSILEYVGDCTMKEYAESGFDERRRSIESISNPHHSSESPHQQPSSVNTCFLEGCKIIEEIDRYGISHMNLDPAKIVWHAESKQWVIVNFRDAWTWAEKLEYHSNDTKRMRTVARTTITDEASKLHWLTRYLLQAHPAAVTDKFNEQDPKFHIGDLGVRKEGKLWGFASETYFIKPNSLYRSLRFMTFMFLKHLSKYYQGDDCNGGIFYMVAGAVEKAGLTLRTGETVPSVSVHSEMWNTVMTYPGIRAVLDPAFVLWLQEKLKENTDSL